MADKDTKRVAGEDLAKEAFAYVGDAKKKSTWKLPIKFKSEAKTKRHIRNAIGRYDSTDMPNAAEKAKAWDRIKAAAKKYGIQIADEKDGKKSSVVEQQRQAEVRASRLARGAAANTDSEDPALAWDSERAADAGDGGLDEVAELPMMYREFRVERMRPVRIVRKAGKADADPLEPDEIKDMDDGQPEKEQEDLPADAPLNDEPRGDGDELAEYGQEGQQQGKDKKKAAKKSAADTDTFEMTFSSEASIERWFGREILDHSPEAVDMSRAAQGLSLLDSHDARSIVGIVSDVRVANKKLSGIARFSRNAPAQAVKRDMADGIRPFTSVGYAVGKYQLEESDKEKGDTYRATRWTPMEVSSVSVPADMSVGVGVRADGDRTYPVVISRANEIHNSDSGRAQADPTSAAPAASPAEGTRKVTVETEITNARAAAAEIIRLGKLHGIEQETTAKWIEEGRTVDQASKEILERIAKGQKALAQPASEEHFDLTGREQSEYNLARLILAAADRSEGRESKCMEMEISDELSKQAKRAGHLTHETGVFMPWSIRHSITPELAAKFPRLAPRERRDVIVPGKRAGLFSGGASVGQSLVFTEPGEFIQFLYNRMRVKELGARTIAGLRENVSFPKQTGRATGSWVTENPGADVADSNLTLGSIASSPKTYQSSSSYSRQLLAQAVIDVDTLVREDLARDLALAVDSVAIQGGGSNQPSGIMATTGVQSFVDAADAGNGGAMVWTDYIGMEKLLEEANADQLGEPSWLTTPQVKASGKTTARLGNTIGLPIWADDDTIDGYEARQTVQVPSNLVKGTSGATLSALILGVFDTLLINMWGSGFEFIVDPYRLKKQGMIELTTFMLVDVVLRYPVAFAVNKAVIAA